MKVADVRLQFNNEAHKSLALTGPAYNNYIVFPSSNLSNSSVTIRFDPASIQVATDANVLLRMAFDIQVSGRNDTTQALLVPTMFGPSFMPLSQIVSGSNISINGSSSTLANGNLFMPQILMTYDDCLGDEFSMTPNYPDTSTDFLKLPFSSTSTRNPLASAYDQVPSGVPRGAFSGFQVISNDAGAQTAQCSLDVAEAVNLSPFAFGKNSFDQTSLTSINNLLMIYQLSNLNRVLSLAYNVDPVTGVPYYEPLDGSGIIYIDSIIVNVTRAELLVVNFSLPESIPRPLTQVSTWANVINYSTSNFTPLASGQTTTLNISNQSLSSIPRSVYIWVGAYSDAFMYSSNPSACTAPIAFLSMLGPAGGGGLNPSQSALTVTFDNITQLQGANAYQLYKISKKNGCRLSWSEWCGMPQQYPYSSSVGSILKMNFAEDITLARGNCVGQSGKFGLSIQIAVTNQTAHTLDSQTAHMVCVFDGISQTGYDGVTAFNQASFSTEELSRVVLNPDLKFRPARSLLGSGFWDTLKGFFSPINQALKDTKILSTLANAIPAQYGGPMISQGAQALGYGDVRYKRRPSRGRKGGALEQF